ncbi:MAG: TonB-dependent receptor [Proteobacteria bacterium]|nr:TonB-dependent receptor [Pseudomonadota bacterium]
MKNKVAAFAPRAHKPIWVLAPLCAVLVAGVFSTAAAEERPVEEILVVGDESLVQTLGTAGSMDTIDEEVIRQIGATHITETLVRIPGVWISRGSGQEHLTAIRSAVLTGAGSCGEFLFMEDAVPVRPAGFCNVNGLFEVNSEQARGIEVWRGPSSAVLGGNAVHGTINVLTPAVDNRGFSIEGGSYDYLQFRGAYGGDVGDTSDQRLGVSFNITDTGGYRDDTSYEQQKLSVVHEISVGGWDVRNTLTGTNLNQETGGFVLGYKAYEDDRLRKTNPNPEAYRDAWSLRAASHWNQEAWQITPYVRRSRMEFLQHFLPGQPLETNEQTSVGGIVNYEFGSDQLDGNAGAQLEYMSGSLVEFQEGPTTGSAFLQATRPAGLHYDYDVDSLMGAVFYDLTWSFTNATRLVHSLRVETLDYDYDNNHLVGNTKDDGTPCGFGGCLYTRPASRSDRFTEVAGRLGLEQEIGTATAYTTVSTGFRPPQTTELYRLQNGQTTADLDTERLTSLEIGIKGQIYSVAAFAERTRNFILRDANGFNVSNGETKGAGVEFKLTYPVGDHLFDLTGTYAEHKYDFDRNASGGEIIRKGNYVDTAPKWIGSARWFYSPGEKWRSEIEVSYLGKHYVNAANTAEYEGHLVFNWRGGYRLQDNVELFVRVLNLTDEKYADRGDFAFGNYRYFPAMPRQFYGGISVDL